MFHSSYHKEKHHEYAIQYIVHKMEMINRDSYAEFNFINV